MGPAFCGYLHQDLPSPPQVSMPCLELPAPPQPKSSEQLGKEWECLSCQPPACHLWDWVQPELSWASCGLGWHLGGVQVRAWDAVSLAGSTLLCTSVLSPVSPVPAWRAHCRTACLLAGWPVASTLPEPRPFSFVLPCPHSGIAGGRQAGQAAGGECTAPAEALRT